MKTPPLYHNGVTSTTSLPSARDVPYWEPGKVERRSSLRVQEETVLSLYPNIMTAVLPFSMHGILAQPHQRTLLELRMI
ncbi:hypothetical protein PM082_004867 [Marasmius tenuissimus]|nr:hypothetical protein PM082_004867 [Marasmius tenuissimus]